MTFRPSTLIPGFLLLAGVALAAQAPLPPPVTPKPGLQVTHREVRQQRRIGQGVRSGALTPRETVRLERQEARIDRTITQAKADGQVTQAEQARITHQQNVQSRRIFRKKHNARKMP
jgi:hypothetical protein